MNEIKCVEWIKEEIGRFSDIHGKPYPWAEVLLLTLDWKARAEKAEATQAAVYANIEMGSTLYTDDHAAYRDFNDHLFYEHDSVKHGAGEYVRGPVGINSIESVWAVMKRGLHGVYHHASDKHLGRDVNEFAFRLNEGNVKRHTLDRLDSFVDVVTGARITYKELIA